MMTNGSRLYNGHLLRRASLNRGHLLNNCIYGVLALSFAFGFGGCKQWVVLSVIFLSFTGEV